MSLLDAVARFGMATFHVSHEVRRADFGDPEGRRCGSRGGDDELAIGRHQGSRFKFDDHVAAIVGKRTNRADPPEPKSLGWHRLVSERMDAGKQAAELVKEPFPFYGTRFCNLLAGLGGIVLGFGGRSFFRKHRASRQNHHADQQYPDKVASGRCWTDGIRVHRPLHASVPLKNQHPEMIAVHQKLLPSAGIRFITFGSMAQAKVAYLGPEGTFSHLVALRRFPKNPGLPCATIAEVVHAVRSGAASSGIVPIENSSGGTITETVDLLIEEVGSLFIREELALDVRLALLGRPGTGFSKIKTLYSHVMPLRHHRAWIREHLPAARLVESSSTAEAAKKAALSATSAALAAPGAAALYGLSILKFPVRPEAVNVTAFLVLGSAEAPPPKGKRNRTAIVAELPQVSGSLYRFLGSFARSGVNLCRIVSRPVPGKPEAYVFYLEVEGSLSDPKVRKALAGAKRNSVRLQIPGSYASRPRYRSS